MSSTKRSMVTEPVAIIGMACRFPGASSPAELWQLLRGGVDAVTEIPADRWNADRFYDPDATVPGKMNTRWGGFLERIGDFDAHFFRVSPREAPHLDPQQRMLMEVTWEALEDAGQVPGKLAGTSTGVFIGIMGSDYADTPMNDPLLVNFYTVTGHSRGIAANRLSHFFDFRGPSMSVDTACSSSLVATNLACRSLWSGESTLAIAGGANLILSPEGTIWYAKAGLLAHDGRCKTFDSRADGLVRSEGVGVVVLKLLSRALADGDPIHAIIKGGAINQDGRSNGLTAPNRWAQEALIREACAQAGVSPGRVSYVEAHGTGTALGDPIEAQALGAVLATDRPDGDFCALGSIKSNIGHTEAAAGVAGLIKVVLMLKHREIPPSLHYQQPNPHIPFAQLPLRVQQSLGPWNGPALAGVNAFGFGGTNAHLVVSEAPQTEAAPAQASHDMAELLPLSARSPEALRALAQAYEQFLFAEGANVSLRDICHTAAVRRTHHEHRLALVGSSHNDLAERLGSFVAGTPHPAIATGRVTQIRRAKLAFVFAGQGPQWWAMGRGLLREEQEFRRAVEQCDELFSSIAGWSLIDELNADEDRSRMGETQVAQPCLFALQIGLVALWRAWGIKPDAVVGHSIGEVAAAYVAGIFTLEDAVRVVFHRSRLMQRATGKGKMAAVALHPEKVAPFLGGYEDRVNVAAHNAPGSCVISGESASVDQVVGALRKQEIQVQELRVDYAFHSRQMWEFGDELFCSLAGLKARTATIPIFSTLDGSACEGVEFGADYWRRQLRETVQFARAADAMLAAGYNTFVELSPHPVLVGALHECMGERRLECAALPSLRRKEDDRAVMLKSAARLYTLGFPLQWDVVQDGRCVPLPRYQWQRERFWLKEQETRNDRPLFRGDPLPQNGSLVGRCMASAVEPETYHWEFDLDAVRLPFLLDHRVQGRTVVPAAMFIEMALSGAVGLLSDAYTDVFDVSFGRALALREGETRRMQLVIKRASDHAFGFQLFSREQGENLQSPWTLHGRGQLHVREDGGELQRVDAEEVRERCRERVTGEDFYRDMAHRGLVYGPSFQGVKEVWRRAGEAVASVSLDAALVKDAAASGVHPLLLDNCLQVIACAFPPGTGEAEGMTYLPVGVERVRVGRKHLAEGVAWSYARLETFVGDAPEVLTADAMLTTQSGDVVLELRGVRLQRVRGGGQAEAARVQHAPDASRREDIGAWLYEIAWRPSEFPTTHPDVSVEAQGKWLIFADESGVGEIVKSRLETEEAVSCVLVRGGSSFRRVAADEFEIDPASAQDFDQLLAEASTTEPSGWRGVVHLWSLDQQEQAAGCGSILHLVQSLDRAGLAQNGSAQSVRLWLVTAGAQPDGNSPGNIAQAPVWGLGRVIAREFSTLRCTMIDVNHETHDANASAVFQELRSASDEQQVVWRDGARYVARLQRRKRVLHETDVSGNVSPTADHVSLRPDATYLITGGLGGLGLKLADWMVQRGARHLVLVGRSGASASAREIISGLEAAGAQVRVVAADVSDPEQVAQTLAEIAATMPPLKGVVHAAGVLEDASLRQCDQDRFARVLAPKVQGAWNLHQGTLDSTLDFFVLFSSISSVLGTTGQAAYAAGNSFLDVLAHQRRALGLHGLSINWGPWAEVGMAASRAEDFARQGVGSIQPEAGLRVLEQLLLEDATQVGVLPVRWPEFIKTYSTSPERELFLNDFLGETTSAQQDHAAREHSSAEATSPLVEQLIEALPAERFAILSARLQLETCRVLGLSPSTQLDVTQGFFDLGMDSLMIAELMNNLQMAIARQFPLSMMFEHANIEALTHYLSEQVLGFKLNGDAPPPAPVRDEALDAALEQLEQLSDEEALALLAEKLPLEQ